jgi:hypothetical protein
LLPIIEFAARFAILARVTAPLLILSVTTALFAIVKAVAPVTSPVCVALGEEFVTVIAPDVVIGEPDTVMPVPAVMPTDVTVPAFAVAPSATFINVLTCVAVKAIGVAAEAVLFPIIEFAAKFAILAKVTALFAIVNAAEPVTSPVCVALGAEFVTVIEPELVTGEPDTVMPVPAVIPTEVTVPLPVPAPMADLNVAAVKASDVNAPKPSLVNLKK